MQVPNSEEVRESCVMDEDEWLVNDDPLHALWPVCFNLVNLQEPAVIFLDRLLIRFFLVLDE